MYTHIHTSSIFKSIQPHFRRSRWKMGWTRPTADRGIHINMYFSLYIHIYIYTKTDIYILYTNQYNIISEIKLEDGDGRGPLLIEVFIYVYRYLSVYTYIFILKRTGMYQIQICITSFARSRWETGTAVAHCWSRCLYIQFSLYIYLYVHVYNHTHISIFKPI